VALSFSVSFTLSVACFRTFLSLPDFNFFKRTDKSVDRSPTAARFVLYMEDLAPPLYQLSPDILGELLKPEAPLPPAASAE